jgi:two-component system phosphate regulon sensor histidine kinase PhoR
VARTLFARLAVHSALLLVVVLLVAGMALDPFIVDRETRRLELRLTSLASLAAVDLPPAGFALQEAVRRRGAAGGVRLTVVDRDGTVLADSEFDPSGMENHADRPEVRLALEGRRGARVRRSPTLGMDMLYVAVPGPLVVRAALPLTDVRAVLWEARRKVLFSVVPALALALGLALFLSRGLTRRFSAMAGFAARLAAGDYGARLAVHGSDELADLERSLGDLRGELERQVGALRRDRGRLQALVDGLPDAVALLDGEGRLAVANEPARRLLRLTRGSLEGLPGAELLREPRLLEALDRFDKEGGASPEPVRLTWPEPACELEARLRPLPDQEGRPGVLVVLRDVTRQAHLERVRTDFVANLSHELRTPLTAVRASAETLLDGALEDPPAARRFLESIRRNALRLEALLADVSDLARIEAGAEGLSAREFDARTPVEHVLELFRAEAAAAGVTLSGELPAEPLPLVSDPDRVESILVNLVQNAVRYTPRGGAVTVAVEAAPQGASYRVRDTGIGIPPKDLPRVTERFYRVDPGRSRAQGGTGLGLSIVKHLVELLRGELRLESEQGRGTTATVTLPSLRRA